MIIKIRADDIYWDTLKRSVSQWRVPASAKTDVLRFVSDLELGKVNRGRKISEGRQAKDLYRLRAALEFFNKPAAKITLTNRERFEKALTSDQIGSRWRQRPYSPATKVDIRKAIQVFLRWRLGEAEAVRLAGWLDTRDRQKTPEFLSEQEIDHRYRKCRTAEQRFIVAVLFDSGARAEEFINIR